MVVVLIELSPLSLRHRIVSVLPHEACSKRLVFSAADLIRQGEASHTPAHEFRKGCIFGNATSKKPMGFLKGCMKKAGL
ncbi:hypothetical protein [Acidocella sp.]|uniref:hypothetical protein n=1 Tax=Acidocella sp. TaxID=50710 RepID=UPI002629FF70|nr:hypothetical protein [Acidocella sp.]